MSVQTEIEYSRRAAALMNSERVLAMTPDEQWSLRETLAQHDSVESLPPFVRRLFDGDGGKLAQEAAFDPAKHPRGRGGQFAALHKWTSGKQIVDAAVKHNAGYEGAEEQIRAGTPYLDVRVSSVGGLGKTRRIVVTPAVRMTDGGVAHAGDPVVHTFSPRDHRVKPEEEARKMLASHAKRIGVPTGVARSGEKLGALTESVYAEAKHPRGRTGEWIKKLADLHRSMGGDRDHQMRLDRGELSPRTADYLREMVEKARFAHHQSWLGSNRKVMGEIEAALNQAQARQQEPRAARYLRHIEAISPGEKAIVGGHLIRRADDKTFEHVSVGPYDAEGGTVVKRGTAAEIAAHVDRGVEDAVRRAQDRTRRTEDAKVKDGGSMRGRVTLSLGMVPSAFAVEHGYGDFGGLVEPVTTYNASKYGLTTTGEKAGGFRWKPGTEPERVVYHYVTGKAAPLNFPSGSRAAEQFSYKPKGNKAARALAVRALAEALRARERGDVAGWETGLREAVLARLAEDGVFSLREASAAADTLREMTEAMTVAETADFKAETTRIKARATKNQGPHEFEAAKWTHPNGHPRCARCGNEEPVGGKCNMPASWYERWNREHPTDLGEAKYQRTIIHFDPSAHPRDAIGRFAKALAGMKDVPRATYMTLGKDVTVGRSLGFYHVRHKGKRVGMHASPRAAAEQAFRLRRQSVSPTVHVHRGPQVLTDEKVARLLGLDKLPHEYGLGY